MSEMETHKTGADSSCAQQGGRKSGDAAGRPEARAAPSHKGVVADSYAYTSPYNSCWLEKSYGRHFQDLFAAKVVRESDFWVKLQGSAGIPEIMIMGNFIIERAGIVSLCREHGINTVHAEDGFFPHYNTMHADPLGFCWESSLPRMIFRGCSDNERKMAMTARQNWLSHACGELPVEVRPPFFLWPLQLIGDQVNRWDLDVSDWTGLLRHFRSCLPEEFQLVIKEHPRCQAKDVTGIADAIRELKNTILVHKFADLGALLRRCSGAAGANSSVLYEARLMFHKPVYVYARGWFSNHTDLFVPVHRRDSRPLNRLDRVGDPAAMNSDHIQDYADWFLAQMLARQIDRERAFADAAWLKDRVYRLSHSAFAKYGEEVFSDLSEP